MSQEVKKENIRDFHGLYMIGTLEGVDFKKGGVFNGNPYPARVILTTVPYLNKQTINGIEIVSCKAFQLIQIATSTSSPSKFQNNAYNQRHAAVPDQELLSNWRSSWHRHRSLSPLCVQK